MRNWLISYVTQGIYIYMTSRKMSTNKDDLDTEDALDTEIVTFSSHQDIVNP